MCLDLTASPQIKSTTSLSPQPTTYSSYIPKVEGKEDKLRKQGYYIAGGMFSRISGYATLTFATSKVRSNRNLVQTPCTFCLKLLHGCPPAYPYLKTHAQQSGGKLFKITHKSTTLTFPGANRLAWQHSRLLVRSDPLSNHRFYYCESSAKRRISSANDFTLTMARKIHHDLQEVQDRVCGHGEMDELITCGTTKLVFPPLRINCKEHNPWTPELSCMQSFIVVPWNIFPYL